MKSFFIVLLTTLACATTKNEQEHQNDFMAADLNQDGFVDASEVRTQYPKLD